MRIEVFDADHLARAEGLRETWGYARGEFERLVAWCDGCARIALGDDGGVGMTFGFPWEPVGWIGSVLVLEEHRGEGIGQALVEATVAALEDHGCETIKLYSTPKAISLYERIGFTGEAQYMIARGGHRRGRDPEVVDLTDRVDEVVELDEAVFPGDRSRLLEDLIELHPETSIGTVAADGQLTGYAIARPGESLTEVGPIVVRGGDAHIAQQLVDGILVRVPEEPEVELTYPDGAWAARSSWECRGFVAVDTPLEMRKGPPVDEVRGSIVAAGGQELG